MAVVAIFGQSPLQLLDPCQQHRDLVALLGHKGFEFGDAFLRRHAPMLHPQGKTG